MDERRKSATLDERRSDVPLRKPRTLKSIWAIRVTLVLFLIIITTVVLLRSGFLRPAEKPLKVPVANGPIKAGQVVELGHIKYAAAKKEQQGADWIMDPSGILGRVVTADMIDSNPFRESLFAPRAPPTAPLPLIAKGWVAVIADSDKVEAPLHLMSPGTTVGILVVRGGPAGGDAPVALVSRRALLVSLPHSAPSHDPNAKRHAAPAHGVSAGLVLQMPPEDAVRFVNAQKEGRIHLILLGPSDADTLTSLPDLGSKKSIETVEVIRGIRRSVETPGSTPEPAPAPKSSQEDQ